MVQFFHFRLYSKIKLFRVVGAQVSRICLQKSWMVLSEEICLISFFYRRIFCMR